MVTPDFIFSCRSGVGGGDGGRLSGGVPAIRDYAAVLGEIPRDRLCVAVGVLGDMRPAPSSWLEKLRSKPGVTLMSTSSSGVRSRAASRRGTSKEGCLCPRQRITCHSNRLAAVQPQPHADPFAMQATPPQPPPPPPPPMPNAPPAPRRASGGRGCRGRGGRRDRAGRGARAH